MPNPYRREPNLYWREPKSEAVNHYATYIAIWRMLDDQWLPEAAHRHEWHNLAEEWPGYSVREVEQAALDDWHSRHPEVRYSLDVMGMHG